VFNVVEHLESNASVLIVNKIKPMNEWNCSSANHANSSIHRKEARMARVIHKCGRQRWKRGSIRSAANSHTNV